MQFADPSRISNRDVEGQWQLSKPLAVVATYTSMCIHIYMYVARLIPTPTAYGCCAP